MRNSQVRSTVGCLLSVLVVGCAAAEGEVEQEPAGPRSEGILASALRAPAAEPTPPSVEGSSAAESAAAAGSLALREIAAPRPVTTSDGQRHLVYELILQNVSDVDQRVVALDVFAPGRRSPLASFSGAELGSILVTADPSGNVPPADAALIFVDLELAPGERPPRALRQTIHTEAGERIVANVPVIRERPIVVSPPLRGESFLDLNGCCRGGHGRAVLPRPEGGVAVSQRFAIDFLQLEGISSFAGDPSDNASYFIHGDDILAAAPGQVVAVRDGVLENDPTQPLPELSLDEATGNFVVQDLGEGRFALYAHLQPGSLRVRPGERIRRGQVLGLVGNTGNSTEPHLHFQVMDGPEPLASDGLPYVFDDFRLQGHVDLSGAVPSILPTPGAERRQNRLPLGFDVVAF